MNRGLCADLLGSLRLLAVALGALACGTESTFAPEVDASVGDAAEPVDAPLADAGADADAGLANPSGGCSGDGGSYPPTGDRNLCVVAGFPAAALVQNGGRVIDITQLPAAIGPAATGDGGADDTAAFVAVFNFLKASPRPLAIRTVPGIPSVATGCISRTANTP